MALIEIEGIGADHERARLVRDKLFKCGLDFAYTARIHFQQADAEHARRRLKLVHPHFVGEVGRVAEERDRRRGGHQLMQHFEAFCRNFYVELGHAGEPRATTTATWRRTSSAASAGKRSYWPSAQRYSSATLRLSTKPVAANPR